MWSGGKFAALSALFSLLARHSLRMSAAKFERSPLCHFCRFPVADTGIPLSTVDHQKLSKWCLQMLNCDVDREDLEQEWCCQFCIWDAKLESDKSQTSKKSKNELAWWIGHDKNAFFHKHFFTAKMMKPCKVSINKLRSPRTSSARTRPYTRQPRAPVKIKSEPDVKPIIAAPILCRYCNQVLVNRKAAYTHIMECRPEIIQDHLLIDYNNYCLKHNQFVVKQVNQKGIKTCHLCPTDADYEAAVDAARLIGFHSGNATITVKTEPPFTGICRSIRAPMTGFFVGRVKKEVN